MLVITITRNSSRFVASYPEIPPDAIIRIEGQHWNKEEQA